MDTYAIPDLTKKLRLAPKTVRRYLREGRIRGRKVGRNWLVAEDGLRAFFAEGQDSNELVTRSDRE